ncbi:hypothetical protein B0H13DRAFT_1918658 [Mycena leptocephala]|nr:hypothetical protein B0H13DRAFT_1918658 [Mycena leptocephala]
MKPQAIFVALCFHATSLAVGSPSLSRVTNSISSLGEQISRIHTTLQALPAFVVNNTDPLGLFSEAGVLLSKLDSATNALKAHGDFNIEDANAIFAEVQKIEPVINAVAESLWTKTDILAASEFQTDEIPVPLLNDIMMLGSACREFQHVLGKSSEQNGAAIPVGLVATSNFSFAHKYIYLIMMPHFSPDFNQNQRLARLLRFSRDLTSAFLDVSDTLDIPMFWKRPSVKGDLNLDHLAHFSRFAEYDIRFETPSILLINSRTIKRVNLCLARQEEGGRIRRFLRNAETSAEIQECVSQLDRSIEDLRVFANVNCLISVTFTSH